MSVFDALTCLPAEITSGENIIWTESLPDYDASTHSVAYNFAGNTPVDGYQTFQVAGQGVGTTWTFTITTAMAPKPGQYAWQKVVTRTSGSIKANLAGGILIVIPNLATAPTTSAAAAMLAAINTAITTLSAGTNQSVSLNGQSFTKKDMTRLMIDRARLQAEVYREQKALATLTGNAREGNVSVEFNQ